VQPETLACRRSPGGAASLGHIDRILAAQFAAGQVPGSAIGSQFAHHVQGTVTKKAFGWFLAAFGLFFTIDCIVRVHG
jgi:uncharacterized membrane protein YfcA